MTTYTDNAATFSTRPEQRVDELRRSGVTLALARIEAGDRQSALAVLWASVQDQWRIGGAA